MWAPFNSWQYPFSVGDLLDTIENGQYHTTIVDNTGLVCATAHGSNEAETMEIARIIERAFNSAAYKLTMY